MIECLLCTERYSMEDVRSGLYRAETMVCSRCYAKMQKLPHDRSCFGKPTFIVNGRKLYGYDRSAVECSELCPDRKVCSLLVRV